MSHNSRLRLPEDGATNPPPAQPEDLIRDFDYIDIDETRKLGEVCRRPRVLAVPVWGEKAAAAEKEAIQQINLVVPDGMRSRYTVLDYEKAIDMVLKRWDEGR